MVAPKRGEYDIVFVISPSDLSETELAVLTATTTGLTRLSNLPRFDPSTVAVHLTFASGRTGIARLKK